MQFVFHINSSGPFLRHVCQKAKEKRQKTAEKEKERARERERRRDMIEHKFSQSVSTALATAYPVQSHKEGGPRGTSHGSCSGGA